MPSGMPCDEQERPDGESRSKREDTEENVGSDIYGNCEHRRRHELYTHVKKITDSIRKRRTAFYGRMTRISTGRLTDRTLASFRIRRSQELGQSRWRASAESRKDDQKHDLENKF